MREATDSVVFAPAHDEHVALLQDIEEGVQRRAVNGDDLHVVGGDARRVDLGGEPLLFFDLLARERLPVVQQASR